MVFEAELNIVLNGVLIGGILALVALGMTLIFGVSGVLNVAHGDFLMLGALTMFWMYRLWGVNPFFSLLLVVPLFLLVGAALNFVLLKPMSAKTADVALASSILVTLGLSNVIEDGTNYWMAHQLGISNYRIDYFIPAINIGTIALPSIRVISLVVVVVITILLRLFIQRTSAGKKIRAVMQDRETAVMLGVNPLSVTLMSFAIGTAAAAAAGVFLLAGVTGLDAFSGLPFTVLALTVVVLGGLGSFPGALIGGIAIGVAQTLTAFYAQPKWGPVSGLIILLLVLLVRPQGIFGRR